MAQGSHKVLRRATCRNCEGAIKLCDNGRGAVWLHEGGALRCAGGKTIALPPAGTPREPSS